MGKELDIKECAGYQKLLAAVERDEAREPRGHDYRGKLDWIVDRAEQYAAATGLNASDILDAWEERRNYWYMNYYQESQQPDPSGERVRVFESPEQLMESVGDSGFRCPACDGVSTGPYECSVSDCDWKAYGLFGTLGKGAFVFVKSAMAGEHIFNPVAWERQEAA